MSSYTITRHGRFRKISATLVSDGSGDAEVTAVLDTPIRVNHAEVVIDLGDTPTTGYDVWVTNADGVDILGGGGVGLTVTGQVALQCKVGASAAVIQGGYMIVPSGDLVFTGADMGDTKTATVNIYGERI